MAHTLHPQQAPISLCPLCGDVPWVTGHHIIDTNKPSSWWALWHIQNKWCTAQNGFILFFFFPLVQKCLPCPVSKLFISLSFRSLLCDQGSFVSHFTDAQLRHPDWDHWREKPPFVLKASLQISSQAIRQAWQKEPFLLCYKQKEIIYHLSS